MSVERVPLQLLTDRLSELYPDEASMRRALALAGVDARRVWISGHALNAWWSAVLEAQHQGRLAALVELALEEYPLDPWLWAAHALVSTGAARGVYSVRGRRPAQLRPCGPLKGE